MTQCAGAEDGVVSGGVAAAHGLERAGGDAASQGAEAVPGVAEHASNPAALKGRIF